MNNKVPASDCRTGTSVGKSRNLGTYPVVEVRGFEPLASSMRPKRSSQLSYTPRKGTLTLAGVRLTQEAGKAGVSLRLVEELELHGRRLKSAGCSEARTQALGHFVGLSAAPFRRTDLPD